MRTSDQGRLSLAQVSPTLSQWRPPRRVFLEQRVLRDPAGDLGSDLKRLAEMAGCSSVAQGQFVTTVSLLSGADGAELERLAGNVPSYEQNGRLQDCARELTAAAANAASPPRLCAWWTKNAQVMIDVVVARRELALRDHYELVELLKAAPDQADDVVLSSLGSRPSENDARWMAAARAITVYRFEHADFRPLEAPDTVERLAWQRCARSVRRANGRMPGEAGHPLAHDTVAPARRLPLNNFLRDWPA